MKKPSEFEIMVESNKYSSEYQEQWSFRDGAKWAISQMEQDDVIEMVNPICPYCGKYKTTQGNGILHQLCECGNTDIPSLNVIEKVKELRDEYANSIKHLANHNSPNDLQLHAQMHLHDVQGFINELNAIIENK